MDRLARIFLFAALLLAGCQPALTPSPTAPPTRTPLPPTLTPAPTATATPAPTATATVEAAPAFADATIEKYATSLNVQVVKRGDQWLGVVQSSVGEVESIEYVDGKWEFSYIDMAKFMNEDGTYNKAESERIFSFHIEEEERDGKTVKWINKEDYARYLEATAQIYESMDRNKLVYTNTGIIPEGGIPSNPTMGALINVDYYKDITDLRGGTPQVIGVAGNGENRLTTVATENAKTTFFYNCESADEAFNKISQQTLDGTALVVIGITSGEVNPGYKGTRVKPGTVEKLSPFLEQSRRNGLDLQNPRKTIFMGGENSIEEGFKILDKAGVPIYVVMVIY